MTPPGQLELGQVVSALDRGLDAIADAICSSPPAGPALADGSAGMALSLCYIAEATANEAILGRAGDLLEHAVDALESEFMGPSLFKGVAGVGWVCAHLERQRLLPTDYAIPTLTELDGLVLEMLRSSPWPLKYDLMFGLVGLGVYALERLPDPCAVECVGEAVDRLWELAEHHQVGTSWLTVPRKEVPAPVQDPHYDLGNAHGVAGVIAFLAEVCTTGIQRHRAEPLLRQAVAWLISQGVGVAGSVEQVFPAIVIPSSRNPEFRRNGWCYGDPGIACSVLRAANVLGSAEWSAHAMGVARASGRRSHASSIDELSLCHGAASIAHLYHRLWQATGDSLFSEVARSWIEIMLKTRFQGKGEEPPHDPCFLTGDAGVGLVLVSARYPRLLRLGWDRSLLVAF
jgi:lantibiotic modifying enzyme